MKIKKYIKFLLPTLLLAFIAGFTYYPINKQPDKTEIEGSKYTTSNSNNHANQPKYISSHSQVLYFENINALEKEADLIVSAKVVEQIPHIDKITEGPDKGILKNYWTESKIKITKVYSNKTKTDIPKFIHVFEGAALDKNAYGGPAIYSIGEYKLMDKNNKYLLFLEKDDSLSNMYSIIGNFQGKIPFNKDDIQFDIEQKDHLNKLFDEAQKKYLKTAE